MEKEKNVFNLIDNEFFTVSMKTKKGKTLYLKSQGNGFEWTFDFNESIWFNVPTEAENFAKKYFKNFKGWEIISVYA